MSIEIVVILCLCAGALGAVASAARGTRKLAQLQKEAQLEQEETRRRSERDQQELQTASDQLKHAMIKADGELKTAAVNLSETRDKIDALETELANERERGDALKQELESARQVAEAQAAQAAQQPAAAANTLEMLKNDPALGPGQFDTLKMMYEQFTANSVLGKKS